MSGNWTGGRRRIKPERRPQVKTLVVVNSWFFCRRDKKGKLSGRLEWSEPMLREASEKWPQVVVFNLIREEEEQALSPVEDLLDYVDHLKIENIDVVNFTADNIIEATSLCKLKIVDIGGYFKPPRNPREVNFLNLSKYFDAPHITWASTFDHLKAKIKIDRPRTFKDLQELRKKKAEW